MRQARYRMAETVQRAVCNTSFTATRRPAGRRIAIAPGLTPTGVAASRPICPFLRAASPRSTYCAVKPGEEITMLKLLGAERKSLLLSFPRIKKLAFLILLFKRMLPELRSLIFSLQDVTLL